MENPARIRNLFGVDLDEVLRDVLSAFEPASIPTIVIGGYAVQQYGYHRTTDDLDIVVLDVALATAVLAADDRFSGLIHRGTGFPVDLYAAGASLLDVPLPQPTVIGRDVIPLADLITLKLDGYAAKPVARSQDRADIVRLIVARDLARDFLDEPGYVELWDGLQAEAASR